MHPYEMFQLLMARHEDRLVKVRPGSLYHAVDRLASGGLIVVAGTQREGNRPERTSYEITTTGHQALGSLLRTLLRTPGNEYPRFPQAIAEAHNLPRAEVAGLLADRIAALTESERASEAAVEQLFTEGVAAQFWLDISYTQAVQRAEIEWLQQLVAELGSSSLAWIADDATADNPISD